MNAGATATRWAAAAVLLTGLMACRSAPPVAATPPAPAPEARIPGWMERTPSPRGEVCAVGAVDRTFFVQDAHARAAEAARLELAKTIEVQVSSVMYDYQSTRGSWVRASEVVQVIASVRDGVVHGAEVRATWRDVHGLHLAPGMTFALACLRTDVTVEQLASVLREAKEADAADVQSVRERAQAAFDELAELEAHKAEAPTPAPRPKPEASMNEERGSNVSRSEEVP